MDKIKILNKIKNIYEQGGNIIHYLKKLDGKNFHNFTSKEDILISYDFQAGSYIKGYRENDSIKFTDRLASVIKNLNCKKDSLMEAGVGEATTLTRLLRHKDLSFNKIYGFDISWSRIKFAQTFVKSEWLDKGIHAARGGGMTAIYL